MKLKEVGKNIKSYVKEVKHHLSNKQFISKNWKALSLDIIFWVAIVFVIKGVLGYVNRILEATGFDINDPSTFTTIAIDQSRNALTTAILAIILLPIFLYFSYLIYSFFTWIIYNNRKFNWKKLLKWILGHFVFSLFGLAILGITALFLGIATTIIDIALKPFMAEIIRFYITGLFSSIVAWIVLIISATVYFNMLTGLVINNKIWRSIAESWVLKRKSIYLMIIISVFITILNVIYATPLYFILWLFLIRAAYMMYYNPLMSK